MQGMVLHVLWMAANAIDEVAGLELSSANTEHGREQGEPESVQSRNLIM